MPTVNQIRAAIAAKLVSVDATVKVHEYERYAKAMSELAALYKSGSEPSARLHGWYVRNIATQQKSEGITRWSIWHTWRIRGFMSLDDADGTEKLFDTFIESVRLAFRDDETLAGLVFSGTAPDGRTTGIQKLNSNPVFFAGVLCHSAELGLTTQHLEP